MIARMGLAGWHAHTVLRLADALTVHATVVTW